MNTFSPMARFYTEQAQDMIRRIEGGGNEVADISDIYFMPLNVYKNM